MNIDTKEIKKGIIKINGKLIKKGMSIPELEEILKVKIENVNDYAGHVLCPPLIEDDKQNDLIVWFNGSNYLQELKLNICGFSNSDSASDYLDSWLKLRDITEWIGSNETATYYKTEFGALMPSLVNLCYDTFGYKIQISLQYGEPPKRKFITFKEKKNNFINIMVADTQYRIQRITRTEADKLPVHNWLGNGPFSLNDWIESPSKNDRKEIIYFCISEITNEGEQVIGVAEFTYLAVWDVYKSGELFLILDSLTEELGIIAYAIEKYGCGLENKKGITPYILAFETIHGEIPHNKELDRFIENKECMKLLYENAILLTSKYVKIPEEDITLVNVSGKKDNMFSYYKKCEDIFINYQRSSKNATVTKASGNASINALKYQLNIPSEWAKQIGLTKEDKSVSMMFDGKKITITKAKN